MRINRYLAAAGLGSRRACETIVRAGRVSVNGARCQVLATEVQTGDIVAVDGQQLAAQPSVHLLLNKPAGYVTTSSDELGRRTVFDLLPADAPRLFHVGRLDKDSEGLLLLTNDGELAQRLAHPRYKLEKEYEVVLDRPLEASCIPRLLKGVFIPIDDGPGAPVSERPPPRRERARAEAVQITGPRKVKVILHQGLKRQIRLMFYHIGYEVESLCRVRLGPLTLGRLRPGKWRSLTIQEIVALQQGAPAAAAASHKRIPARGRPPKASAGA